MRSRSTAVFVNREPESAAGSTGGRITDFLGLLDPEDRDSRLCGNLSIYLPVISHKAWIFIEALPFDI